MLQITLSRLRPRFLIALLSVCALLAAVPLLFGQAPHLTKVESTLNWSALPEVQANTISLSKEPIWPQSAAFVGPDLYIPDTGWQEILKISAGGTVESVGDFDFRMPSLVRPAAGGGIYIEDDAENQLHLIRDAETGKSTRTLSIRGWFQGAAGEVYLGELYDWIPVGDAILAYGDFGATQENPHEKRGFIYLEWPKGDAAPGTLRPVTFHGEFEPPAGLDLWYLRTRHNFASIGDEAFILGWYDGEPAHGSTSAPNLAVFKINVVDSTSLAAIEATKLTDLPEGFGRAPILTSPRSLPAPQHYLGVVLNYQEIEDLQAAAGLYAQNGELYALLKGPNHLGRGTAWALLGIDSVTGRNGKLVTLPSRAAHLTVATTEDQWLLVERGAAVPLKNGEPFLRVGPMVSVPTARLQEAFQQAP